MLTCKDPITTGQDRHALLERVSAPAFSPLPPPRLLLVYAHPDDEVIAMGGRMERLSCSRLLTVTDGAPADGGDARHHGFTSLERYRGARQGELLAALAHAGLGSEILAQQTPQVPDQQASFHLEALARAVADEIRAFRPEAVLTHPYEGGHPDHDACAFAAYMACCLVQQADGVAEAVPVIETPFYHAAANGSMQTGRFLREDASSIEAMLSTAEQTRKRARLACFRSQAETLEQFGVERETFRLAPTYDFMQRPHHGQLFYEQFSWGMEGERFCQLAREATMRLFAGRATLPPEAFTAELGKPLA